MLFNSYGFLFLFLPLVWGLFKLLPSRFRLHFLIFASLCFYGYFSWAYLLLLLVSIGFNYTVATMLTYNNVYKSTMFAFAILINLLPLAYFKYTFNADNSILFPLAISFYTFQQIAFLIDVYQKKVTLDGLSKYLYFVLFFPQLIAGPIVHYKELISQVEEGKLSRINVTQFASGLFLFSMGLFKKVAIADLFLAEAAEHFSHVNTLQTSDAWVGVFSYSLGIYFDFSAYSDMAIGLGLLFGMTLPVNFLSPYKARSLVAFWRVWHMTLSHFLKNYLYIPLGGNRHGKTREVLSLLVTMTLAGIWHGTGWAFLLWGFAHGVLLVVVHVYTHLPKRWVLPPFMATFLTFITVTLLWVLFRSDGIEEAWQYYRILFSFSDYGHVDVMKLFMVLVGLCVVWFLPNSMQILAYPKLKTLNRKHALVGAVLLFISLRIMAELPAQSFVYFNF